MKEINYSTKIGDRDVSFIFSDLAEKTNGSVLVRCGDSVVLVVAVMSKRESDRGYFPLSVEFEERFYSVGAILGGRFMRREGRPSDAAVLKARAIDRTIRPLFPKSLQNEVQIVATTLSIGDVDPDLLGILGASVALHTSSIPWNGPVGAVTLGLKDDQWIPMPSIAKDMNLEGQLLVCGGKQGINMIEAGGKEIAESKVEEGLQLAEQEILKQIEFIESIAKKEGVEKEELVHQKEEEKLEEFFKAHLQNESVSNEETVDEIFKGWTEKLSEEFGDISDYTIRVFAEKKMARLVQKNIVDGKRMDGRKIDELRKLFAKAGGISKVVHGSGIFFRGQTHILSVLTLGGPQDALLVDTVDNQDTNERFIHHYNFPQYSAGEVGRIGGFNRRMIGHGELAEKAIAPVLPNEEEFPYTIRIVSEAFTSGGSTSMGSVCGSTLALMDAGVPIKKPVAGIAMGIAESDNKYVVITDIGGAEDAFGGMDLKVAGTRDGITAIQMDIKLPGIPLQSLTEGINKAKEARIKIIETMEKEINTPRDELSTNAPHIKQMRVSKDSIGLVIGTGGKTIRGLKEEFGVDDISVDDDGVIHITGKQESTELVADKIKQLTGGFEVGEHFEGTVATVMPFGVFVNIAPGVDGLVHISEISPERLEKIDGILSVGDKVPVVVKNVDRATKKIALSIKDRDPNFLKNK